MSTAKQKRKHTKISQYTSQLPTQPNQSHNISNHKTTDGNIFEHMSANTGTTKPKLAGGKQTSPSGKQSEKTAREAEKTISASVPDILPTFTNDDNFGRKSASPVTSSSANASPVSSSSGGTPPLHPNTSKRNSSSSGSRKSSSSSGSRKQKKAFDTQNPSSSASNDAGKDKLNDHWGSVLSHECGLKLMCAMNNIDIDRVRDALLTNLRRVYDETKSMRRLVGLSS